MILNYQVKQEQTTHTPLIQPYKKQRDKRFVVLNTLRIVKALTHQADKERKKMQKKYKSGKFIFI